MRTSALPHRGPHLEPILARGGVLWGFRGGGVSPPPSLMAGCKVGRSPGQAQWMWGWAGGLGGCCLGALPPSGGGRACGHLQTCWHNSSAPGVPIDRHLATLSCTSPAPQSWSCDLSWLPPLQQLGQAVRLAGRCWRWGAGSPGWGSVASASDSAPERPQQAGNPLECAAPTDRLRKAALPPRLHSKVRVPPGWGSPWPSWLLWALSTRGHTQGPTSPMLVL